MLIYDIEIVKAIPPKNPQGPYDEGIQYCAGWQDHANMGVSVIGAYDYVENRSRVFCADNIGEFAMLCKERTPLVGFNSIAFDNAVLCKTYPQFDYAWHEDERCYDLLREIWVAAGLGPTFKYPSHVGYGLDAVCERNFGTRKSGDGALAPVLWQRGDVGTVIDYCLNDVWLTKQILDKVLADGTLVSPKDGSLLTLRRPT